MSKADELRARILGPLTDASPMPFGKHEGENMASVPAGYLLWCLDQDWIKGYPKVVAYIEKCRDTLEVQAAEDRATWKEFREQEGYDDDEDGDDDPRSGQFGRLDQ